MKLFRCIFFASLILTAGQARADSTWNRVVKGGARTAIGSVGVVTNDCKGGPLPMVSTEPAHGTLELLKEDRPVTNPNAGCAGKSVPQGRAYYTATKGYRGPDSFVLRSNVYNGRVDIPSYVTVNVTVQ